MIVSLSVDMIIFCGHMNNGILRACWLLSKLQMSNLLDSLLLDLSLQKGDCACLLNFLF